MQQAYSLLLRGKVTLLQYKVYASLSRLGYRIFRHSHSTPTAYEKKMNLQPNFQIDIEIRNQSQHRGFGNKTKNMSTSSGKIFI